MKWCSLVAVAVLLSACGNRQSDAGYVADLQAKSPLGPIAGWKLDPALQQIKVQQMRDRAYRYCLTEQASDQDCLEEQDHSLFEYANSFRLVRIFRSESLPTLPFAVAHKQDPAAFERIHRYCRSLYEEQGSRDARALGPGMSAGVGADFFGVVPVS